MVAAAVPTDLTVGMLLIKYLFNLLCFLKKAGIDAS